MSAPRGQRRCREHGRTLVETVVASAGLVALTTGVFSLIVESQRSLGSHLRVSGERGQAIRGYEALRQAIEAADPATVELAGGAGQTMGADHAVSFQVVLDFAGGDVVRGARGSDGAERVGHRVWIGVVTAADGTRQLVQRVTDLEDQVVGEPRLLHADLGDASPNPSLELERTGEGTLQVTLRVSSEDGVTRVRRGIVRLRNRDTGGSS